MTSPVLTAVTRTTLTGAADSAGRSASVFAVTPGPGSVATPTNGRPGAADTMAGIVEELGPRFAGRVPCEVIVACVDQAIRDLHESICREALPEMAIRLAAVRLDRRIQQEADPAVLGPDPVQQAAAPLPPLR
jgi:hypothetical protein